MTDKKSTQQKRKKLDIHTMNASLVACNDFFYIGEISRNENIGMLVGTEVMKCGEPESRESKYWNGLYWSVLVLAPNGETRRVSCDVLIPRDSNKYFKAQEKVFDEVRKNTLDLVG